MDGLQLDRDLAHRCASFMANSGVKPQSSSPCRPSHDDTVSYAFQVTEGELYRMGKLEIQGVEPEQAHKLEQTWKLARR